MLMQRQLGIFVILLLVLTSVVAGVEKLRFKYSEVKNILLSWDETWDVGSPNMMAFLMAKKKLTIKVAVDGNPDLAYKAILRFKCHQGQREFSAMDLTTVTTSSSEKQCPSEIPFSVRTLDAVTGEYEFTLLASSLTADHAFSKKLELAVLIETAYGSLESNSLFVWNLDLLSQMNDRQLPGKSYTQRFLTGDAMEFLKNMNMNATVKIGKIAFLDPRVTQQIKEAPAFLRAKLNLGAILNFDAGACESYQISRASLFVNYHSKLGERTQNLLKHMHLNLETGVLYYSTYGLSSAITDFYLARSPAQIGICATLSFAGHAQPYDSAFSVEQRIPVESLSYRAFGSKESACEVPEIMNSQPITIFAGMDYTPLVCPIICSDPNEVYRFTHVSPDHREISLIPDGRKDFSDVDGIRVSKTGNIIEFPPTTQNRHAGQYSCHAGGKSFTFDAQIINMPRFKSGPIGSEISGTLPPVIYAMEGESMTYSCTAFYSNVETVIAMPVFFSPMSTGGKETWRELTLADFNSLVGASASDSPVDVNPWSESSLNKTLKIKVTKVPQAKTSTGINFTHRFACNVSVGSTDAAKIGMPSYRVQTASSVFFVSRPTPESFDLSLARNCSVQGCTTALGAQFVVSLKPELTAYLKSIGVEVVGLFKIDDVYLTDLNIINQKGVSEIAFDNKTNRLSFKVNPISDRKVLEELQKRKTLTPVFNLRYPKTMPSKLASLQLLKDAYGSRDVAAGERDCRADPNCFYSTDYDVAGGSLQRIVISINFKGEAVPLEVPNTAGTSLVIGIIAAVILLLVIAVLLVFLLRRDSGQTYMLDEKERQQGNHPEVEAKDEQFKEYQRPDDGGLKASRLSLNSSISAASKDDQELEAYGNDDDIDYTKFVEDGSFIGDYSTDTRKRDAFNAASSRHERPV